MQFQPPLLRSFGLGASMAPIWIPSASPVMTVADRNVVSSSSGWLNGFNTSTTSSTGKWHREPPTRSRCRSRRRLAIKSREQAQRNALIAPDLIHDLTFQREQGTLQDRADHSGECRNLVGNIVALGFDSKRKC
jgi:hypothetical protein